MTHFQRALDLMSSEAIVILKNGGSVVFDFGGGLATRPWLKQMAEASGSKIEVFHLEVPIEERRRRIQQRNIEKDPSVYFFNMSDEEFDRHNSAPSQAPPEEPGFKVTRKDNR